MVWAYFTKRREKLGEKCIEYEVDGVRPVEVGRRNLGVRLL